MTQIIGITQQHRPHTVASLDIEPGHRFRELNHQVARTWMFVIAKLVITSTLPCSFVQQATAQQWRIHEVRENLEFFSEVDVSTTRIVSELTEVRTELQQLLKLPDDPKTVQVVIFKSMSSYRGYLSTRIPEARNRRAIFYKSGDQLQIYAVYHKELITDLRHEFTHVLLHQTLPFIPLWIDEGIAEFLEETPAQRGKSARLSSLKWKCRVGWTPSLQRLEKMGKASAMTSEDYRDSWAWVHYLLGESVNSRQLLRDYLSVISAGGAPGTFSDWATSRDPTVTKRIGSYFRRFHISVRSGPRR